MSYDFKPGDEVYVYRRWMAGEIRKVQKVVRGLAVVDGQNFRMNGTATDPHSAARIEPATDAHRLAVRRNEVLDRIASIRRAHWANLPVERLEAIVAEVAAAVAAGGGR